MWWILFVVIQALVIFSGIRREERAGLWSWSKFVFALGFAGLEIIILIVPIHYIGVQSRWFVPVFSGCGVIAALNFIWMIIVARRWKLPDGRTSLQAYRDEQQGK
ncbi:MAG TPA: hypothetical protein VGI45_21440 [Terracidiphilus sp.]|jgi:hypothetical protein